MYNSIKSLYNKRQFAASTNAAMSGEDIDRRQALEAIAGTAMGLKSFFSPAAAEADDWGIGVEAIRKVIPEGRYEVRAWNSESDRVEQHFLYVISKPGQTRILFRNEPNWTVTDLKVMDLQGIEKRILADYSSVMRDPYSIEVHKEKLKNGQEIYFVRKRKVTPDISFGKLYLRYPGSLQAPGSGGGPGGGTGTGGPGGPGGGGGI